jgi:hypothetical protein
MATGLLNTIRRLVDAGFPESTAQKIATGELPMDEASRMARAAEQGYTIPAYTGAKTGDIMAFDPNMGRRGRTDTGTWFSQEPQIANTYAGSIDSGTIYPVLLRDRGLTEVDAGGQNWSRIMPDTPIRYSSGAQTRAGELTGDVLFQDYTNTNDIARLARRQGDEGVRFYNVQDRGPYMGGVENVPPTADNLAIFNPANIRSRFAAFDPDQIGNPNILAGGAGILGVGLMASEDAQAREPELFWDKITESLGLSTKQSDLASEIQGLLPTMNQPRVPGGSTAEMYDNQPIGFWGEGHANPQDPNWQAVASNFWRNRVADAMAAPGFLADVVDLPTTFMSRQLEPEQDIPYFRRSGRAYDATQQGLSLLFGEPVPVEDPQTAGFLAMTDVASAAVPGLLASTAPQAIRAGQRISRAAEELGETVGRNIQNYQPMTPGSPRAQIGAVGDLTPSRLGEKQPTGLFSQLEVAARDLPQQKGSGQQMLAMIQKQGGVKPEEIKWTGLDDFLANKPTVTKGEIEDYLLNNRVELQEVKLGGATSDYPFRTGEEWNNALRAAERSRNWEEAERIGAAWEAFEGLGGAGQPKFSKYTLPGGENYREVLLTLPRQQASLNADAQKVFKKNYNELNAEQKRMLESEYQTPADAFRSSHYDQPNVLAHVRLNDRIDADGKKVLFVEEVQSDWHQAGRKKGYSAKPNESIKEYQDLSRRMATEFMPPESREIIRARLDELRPIVSGQGGPDGTVPDAPFKTSWHELALRRVMQEASEKGYDRIAFTKGAQQADRYDLSKQVDSIDYINKGNKMYLISAKSPDGRNVIDRKYYYENELEDIVGKEIAEKIISGKGKKRGMDDSGNINRSLSDVDLKVGGKGMKGFYDQILPKSLNKLGKKFDAKVGTTNLQTGDEVWSMDITPKMRQTASDQGMPLFSAGAPIGAGLLAPQEEPQQNTPTSLMDF